MTCRQEAGEAGEVILELDEVKTTKHCLIEDYLPAGNETNLIFFSFNEERIELLLGCF